MQGLNFVPLYFGNHRFFSFFSSCFTPICNPLGYGRHLVPLHLFSSLVRCPSLFLIALSCHICFCHFWPFSLLGFAFYYLVIQQLFELDSNSLSLAPSLPPTSVTIKNSSSGPNAFSSATRFAYPFFSVQPCQLIFFALKLLTSFLLCLVHLRHFVYRCSIDCSACPHSQHLRISITLLLTRNVPIAPCPTLS